MELATYAQSKYDVYRNNTEQIEEEQALLSREFSNQEYKNEYRKSKRYDMHNDSRPYEHNYYEDNFSGLGFQNGFNDNTEIFLDDGNDYQELYDNELDIPYSHLHESAYQDRKDDFEKQSIDLYQNNYSDVQKDFEKEHPLYSPNNDNNPFDNNGDKINSLNDEFDDWCYQQTDFAEYENDFKDNYYDRYDNESEHKYHSDDENLGNERKYQSEYDNFNDRADSCQSIDSSLISEDFYQGHELFQFD